MQSSLGVSRRKQRNELESQTREEKNWKEGCHILEVPLVKPFDGLGVKWGK